jgi:hypothetical protein
MTKNETNGLERIKFFTHPSSNNQNNMDLCLAGDLQSHLRGWRTPSKRVDENSINMINFIPIIQERKGKFYAGAPGGEKPRTAILAGNYGVAGALDLYRED